MLLCLFLGSLAFYLAYINERFTCYTMTMMVGGVGMVASLGAIAVFLFARNRWQLSLGEELLIAFTPAGAVAVVYLIVFLTPAPIFPFEVRKQRVVSLRVEVDKYSGLIAGLSTVASLSLIKIFNGELLIVTVAVTMFSCCFFIIGYSRNVIRGLRTLRIQERERVMFFTFENLEQIRSARLQWVIGRLVFRLLKELRG